MAQKKVTKKTTKPKEIKKREDRHSEFYCVCCSKKYVKQAGNFYKITSPLFAGNDGYIPICRRCMDELFKHYTEVLGSEEKAIERMCMKFDIYFHPTILKASLKTNATQSRFSSYISKSMLRQYKDLTYDSYLDEKSGYILSEDDINDIPAEEDDVPDINIEDVEFFGFGFEPQDYIFLRKEYDDWTSRHECKTKAQEELFKRISYNQLERKKTMQKGGKTDTLDKSFQDLMGSANIKPVQNNDNALETENTFGTLIEKWEKERPIDKSEIQDVDNIKEYIETWFFGGLCDSIGIENSYSDRYKNKIKDCTVLPPSYEDCDG